MHWYWFHIFTMRSSFSSSECTVNLESRFSQSVFNSSSAASTCASVWYFARSSSAGFLLITSGAENFWSCGFSQYPSTNIKLLVSPGARVTLIWCEPIGLHPLATELCALPSSTTCGSLTPLYAPKNSSRLVSKPSISEFTENTA